jgi:uncharacterized protein (DUF58 family)
MTGARTSPHRRLLVFAALGAGIAGLVTASTALVAASLGCALFFFQAWLLRSRGLDGLRVQRQVYGAAFEEDMVGVDLLLENHGAREGRLIVIADTFGPGLASTQVALEPGPLPPQRRRRLQYRTFCSRQWGMYTVGPLWVGTWDPMGLFHAQRRLEQVAPMALYPRVHEITALGARTGRAALSPEELSAPRTGQSAFYLGVRDYWPGDDWRSIHWPAMARRGEPMVREREVDLVPPFTLFVDLHREGRAGVGTKSTLEYVVRVGASLLWTATRRGQSVQVVGEGADPLLVPAGRGEAHLSHALFELIHARQDGDTSLPDLVERYLPHLHSGSAAALVAVTTAVDLARIGYLLETFRTTNLQPLLIFVDGDSFAPLHRPRVTRAEAEGRRQAFVQFLDEAGVPGVVLGIEQELAETLPRPDLFGVRA